MLKLYFFISVGISFLAVLIQGCVSLPNDVIMPQWDTDLNLPLTTKTYILNDIIKSPNYISINSPDSTYLISIDSLGQNVSISQFVNVNTESSSPTVPVFTNNTTQTAYILFPDSSKLSQAVISKGNFKIVAHNISAVNVQLTINFPGLKKNGNPFPVILTVPANTDNITQTFDFGDCIYSQPLDQDPDYNGQLWIEAGATSSAPGFYSITFEAFTSDFVFSSFTGYLPTKSLGIYRSSFSLNIGEASNYRGKVDLKTGSLSLVGKYHSLAANPFIVGVNNLRLVGKRNDGQDTVTLEFSNPLSNSFKFDASGNYSTVYNENNSNITSFIAFLPDSVLVSAEYIMNPDNDQAYKTVRSDDSISFMSRFTAISVLHIKQTTFTDTVNIEIKQDDRDQILKGKGAQLTVDIQNAIPLNSWIKVILTDINYNPILINGAPFVITKNTNGTDSVSIAGSQTDINGHYLNSSASTTTITLDSTQIRQFAQNAQHAIISVTVETSHSNNVPVVVHASDWIKLNVFGRVTYRIQKNN
jgi:hypothetical protein